MRILWLTNIPSPYRVDFFNELGKYCDLTVGFEKTASKERDASWTNYSFKTFEGKFLKGISINTDSAICADVIQLVRRQFDRIVVTNFSDPTGMMAIAYMKMKRIPYWIESDGGQPQNGEGIKERIKRKVLSSAELYFSTSKEHDKYYLAYGANADSVVRYPFTSLHKGELLDAILTDTEKHSIREKLGISEKKIILSVGRFSYLGGYGKGYDVLIKAAKQMSDEYGWYIVGGEPTEEFRKLTDEAGLRNFHFVKHLGKEALREYYKAADLFILMSVKEAWGLVINEAMACGLPIITTDKCVAGLELVEDGVNGYLVPVGDEKKLQEAISRIELNNSNNSMSIESLKRIQLYTIENMAKVHMDYFMMN